MPLPQWLKNAFAVDHGPIDPTPEQAALVERLARVVVRRGMTVPALAFLEMSQPLNYVTAQAIHFFTPMIGAVANTDAHRQFADLLEHRGSIEYICQAIERASQQSPTR
jgi:ubiquinone/menaquinone biosynthesis C-methylase UbiE